MKSRKDMWIRGLAMMSLVMVMVAFTQAPQYAAPNNTQSNAKVKNVIVLISDGCGYNCFQAASYYQYGKIGEQVYEKFPFKVGVSTYEFEYLDYVPAADPTWGPNWYKESGKYILKGYDTNQFWNDFNYPIWIDASLNNPYTGWYVNNNTDSASAATAMATGFKTKDGSIGYAFPLNPDGSLVVDAEGKSDTERKVNLVEVAKSHGMAAGVVSSVYMSHATPAGFVAHNKSRGKYAELANEMIYDSGIDVIMAPGSPDYDDSGNLFPCAKNASGDCDVKWSASSQYHYYYYNYVDANGKPQTVRSRLDYVGNLNTWNHLRNGVDDSGNPFPFHVIREKNEFQAMAAGETPARVLGLPKVNQTLQAYRPGDRTADPYEVAFTPDIPTLEEMSKAALNVLDNNPKGFFLMIEGGAVDWANHSSQGGRMIEEQVDFNRAIEAVVDWVKKNSNWGETMVLVTADHETGYIWGPGSNPTHEPIVNNGADVRPGMQYYSPIGWHTNSLVPLFAKGDAARLFNGYATNTDHVYGPYIDNTDIFKVISCAIENYQQRPNQGNGDPAELPGKAKGKK